MAVYSKEHLFMLILIFFASYTAFVGLCNEASSGGITLSELSSLGFGNTVPGQITPAVGASSNALGSPTLISVEDFTNSTGYNKSTIVTQAMNGYFALWNPWTQQDNVGYVLTNNLGFGTSGHFAVIGVQENNGVYDATYYINNSVNSPSNLDISQYGYNAQAKFSAQSISVSEGTASGVKTIGLASANQYGNLISGLSMVETIYNPTTESLTINLNGGTNNGGSTLTTTLDSIIGPATQNVPPYIFAGVEAYTNGFTVQKIVVPVQTQSGGTVAATTGFAPLDAIIQAGSNLLSAMAQFAAMLSVFFGLTSSAVVPFWIWGIFAIPQIGTLVYMGLELARGTG
jgi:hypothetical protein